MEVTHKNTPRDVFLYLLTIISMTVVAVSFGTLLFQIINVSWPDLATDYYYSQSSYYSAIRFSIAALIVVFPVYLWSTRFLRRDVEQNPEKRDLKIRRWLLYLTVFVAALVIIGDLIALLRNFLEGELSTRFILKVVSILFIAGSIFAHYFSELREKGKEINWVSWLDKVVVVVVVAGIVGSFFITGSPAHQRLVRFDERRINDLNTIQYQIINYWQRKEVLPPVLGSLRDDLSGFELPLDPETGENYEYRATGPLQFELCATFSTEGVRDDSKSPVSYPTREGSLAWSHSQGRQCFSRTIDPELYPPITKIQ